ncbi:hypothetical protein AVEN_62735-1 [Araneus ventricosus]|uniref:Uncharacterized protein n=1 Tax=Araneus ventricosus TaxID=182803 RepID=A0A4Y2ILR0_ARAVE|nr:hypothetical protein AVEN_62735-1 [Araneus ventricosus]
MQNKKIWLKNLNWYAFYLKNGYYFWNDPGNINSKLSHAYRKAGSLISPLTELTPQEILQHPGPKSYIRYSLHLGSPLSTGYTVQVLVPTGISFFDVMRVAAYENHFSRVIK